MTKAFFDTLSNTELINLEDKYRKRDIAIFPIGILWIIFSYYAHILYHNFSYGIIFLLIFTIYVINHNVKMRRIDRILTDREIALNKQPFLEDIVLGISILVFIAFLVFQANFFNDFYYGKCFDEKRKEFCLFPFQENYTHTNYSDSGDAWENTSSNKQGLHLELKEQHRRWNYLESELDRIVYTEGDSIRIVLINIQNFPHSMGSDYYFYNEKGSICNFLNLTKNGGKANYKRLFDYLKYRGDSLQLNQK